MEFLYILCIGNFCLTDCCCVVLVSEWRNAQGPYFPGPLCMNILSKTSIDRCTVFGRVVVSALNAEDPGIVSIFTSAGSAQLPMVRLEEPQPTPLAL
eukprot:6487122-Amphidinium_carterae.1